MADELEETAGGDDEQQHYDTGENRHEYTLPDGVSDAVVPGGAGVLSDEGAYVGDGSLEQAD